MLRAAIFDFDGVVVDTEPIHYITFKQTLAQLGIEIPKERWYREFTGIGSKNIIRILFQENKINEEVEKWFEKRRKNFFDYVKNNGVNKIDGIDVFLKILKTKNIKTGIATGSGRELTKFVLQKISLSDYFDVIVSADDVTNKKPHPEVFLKAAELLGVSPNKCIAFEDSPNGVKSAKAAGMKLIGVESPSLPGTECDFVIKDFQNLKFSDLQKLIS